MREFIKVQLGAIAGSAADFLLTYLCTEWFGIWYVISNIAGNCTGGFIQFSLSRRWIFKSGKTGISVQLLKYGLFFLGNILLSVAGTYAFTEFFQFHYIVSKLLSSVLFGLSYNYLAQKYFVFA